MKHIKALGTTIFSYAVVEEFLTLNPWHEVKIPQDAIEPERTQHYTIEEAEDLISALVDHVDCQLVIALSYFLGLRPGEIAALRWKISIPILYAFGALSCRASSECTREYRGPAAR